MTAPPRQAGLPMYAEVEFRPAVQRWWTGLAGHLRDRGVPGVPDLLAWPEDRYRQWRDPGLLLGQTCGYPLMHYLAPDVKLVATPHYSAPGCDGPRYAAHVVVREDDRARSLGDLRGARLSVNGEDSYSGYHVWRRLLPVGEGVRSFFGQVAAPGSHRASIRSVLAGEADACAVDCVTHALLSDWLGGELRGTRILATSPTAPGLPYVTAAATPDDEVRKLRDGLFAALADPTLKRARKALRLAGASVLDPEDYRDAFLDPTG
ncbi:MAG: PhnD/SsuA/transferrin family substrate-binding protein [Alphaproteobacteria bacterium]|nr:PhnD/SsuA/transferrin family substrate-binding protein [Alphaproteobacteria bacterium]